MSEVDEKSNLSWVYNLPFLSELIKRVKIILLLHITNKHKLLQIIRNQRLNAATRIISSYKKYKYFNQIKKEYFIRKLISERKKAIIKIQRNARYYLMRLKIKKIIRKENGCYSIFCDKINATRISVKIFTNYNNNEENMIFPMKYCPIRKYFIFLIPKTKFILAKKDMKIIRFYFIYNGNSFFFDEQYKLVNFKGKIVHEINFSQYDNLINEINEKNCHKKSDKVEKKGSSCKTDNFNSKRQKSTLFNKESISILNFSSDEEDEKLNTKGSKEVSEQKKEKFERKKKKGKSCQVIDSAKLKIVSILKNRNSEGRKKRRGSCLTYDEPHVKFGTVTFSY